MIQCLEVALYQSCKSRTKDLYLAPVCTFQPSPTLSYSTHIYISGNKRKRKEADYIFIHQHCCFSSCCIQLKTEVNQELLRSLDSISHLSDGDGWQNNAR